MNVKRIAKPISRPVIFTVSRCYLILKGSLKLSLSTSIRFVSLHWLVENLRLSIELDLGGGVGAGFEFGR